MSYTSIVAPRECPSCSALLERVNDQLFCTNNVDCPAQSSGKLINFCKKLKIKGFGQSTVDKLGITTINDLINLTEEQAIQSGFSEHMSAKLVNTVKDRIQRGIDFREFLAAQSIPLLGDSSSSKLEANSIDDIDYDLCRECGLGDKVSFNLSEWVELDWPTLKPLWKDTIRFSKSNKPSTDLGMTVVITGKLNDFKNRAEATKHLESLGFTVKSSVTKTTDFLICEDGTTGSSYKKAESLNKPITTIKYLEDNYVKQD